MITTRNATRDDIPVLYEILNEIVEIGGTTAIMPPFSQSRFEEIFWTENSFSLVVAIDENGEILGWQSLDLKDHLPKDVGDIGSYVKTGNAGKGIGSKLIEHTIANAKSLGHSQINATIRADNQSGLTYYTKMGFVDHSTDPSFTLKSGKVVGRVSKRFDLG